MNVDDIVKLIDDGLASAEGQSSSEQASAQPILSGVRSPYPADPVGDAICQERERPVCPVCLDHPRSEPCRYADMPFTYVIDADGIVHRGGAWRPLPGESPNAWLVENPEPHLNPPGTPDSDLRWSHTFHPEGITIEFHYTDEVAPFTPDEWDAIFGCDCTCDDLHGR